MSNRSTKWEANAKVDESISRTTKKVRMSFDDGPGQTTPLNVAGILFDLMHVYDSFYPVLEYN